ncbi:eukaryotic translation initiation factor 3 subunit A [Tribolium castaneum]|uniref:Eukaryotic translation initiation factor 3 subunit A n=1 Tax=Tribolium castaneum TaxID=7070 RepID=D6X0N8_TRICA|nr:PREDICTED: eukaryotic translation initiation factor 3 subunit A [Tribolium castaneum]EFA10123.1 Eukaryotic translation initiation factor 3 subunit A-like Protein [Tribolium castaneum]|eukprot:XP_973312.1 PREDICTED: eukaryotic translation initiation factor 3 subunit A [Tribolium castaneum]
MARYGQRPENALKRANEFIEVGKPARALDTLQEVFRNKKWAYNWSESVLEPIMFKYLDLCVELKKSHIAKEGLFQYRNMFQSVNVGSLENVIRGYLRMAEEKTENAREQSAQAVIDIDDLDNLATPESILLSAVSGEDAQDRSDRTILTPWVKFLWESYCQCLELLRTNAHVENLYHDIARMAFQFCLKYNRKTEFRKLCDKLRKHLEDICKLPAQVANVSMSKPETQQLNLETRLHQLDFAIQMELWQEAYKAIEDIHNLMNMSKKMPVPKTMANYYQKLAMVFWKAGNYLFHAAALFKLFQLSKEMKKNITQEELQRMACRVLIATLSIPLPSAHPEFDRFIETDKSPLEKAQRLAVLLGLFQPPTRASLLKDLVRVNVVSLASTQLQDLYNWLEVDFHPLLLCSRVHTVIQSLQAEENLLQQYIPALQDVTLVRLVRQIAQVYQTIEFARLLELAKFTDAFHLERLLVDCVRHNDMQIRIDHGKYCVHFGMDLSESQREDKPEGPTLQVMPSEQVRNQLVNMATVLNQAINVIYPNKKKAEREKMRSIMVKNYHETKAQEHEKILQRHKIIEDRKEYIERLNTVREEEEQRRLEELARQQALAEQKRLEQEREEREKKRAQNEIQQIKDRHLKEKLQQISQTGHGQKILKKLDEDDIKKLDADQIAAKEAEELQKERRELQAKLKSQEKKVDYFERAKRLEEIPLLQASIKERQLQDQAFWEQQEKERIAAAIEERKLAVATRDRLVRMKPDKDAFLEKLKKERNIVYEDKLKEFEKLLNEERQKRLLERKLKRKEERRTRYIKEKQEEEERKLAEQKRKEEEERQRLEEIARKEREEKERVEREERDRRAREQQEMLDRTGEKQRKRMEEIEKRLAEDQDKGREKPKDSWRAKGEREPPKREGGDSSWRRGEKPEEPKKVEAWRPRNMRANPDETKGGDAWRSREAEAEEQPERERREVGRGFERGDRDRFTREDRRGGEREERDRRGDREERDRRGDREERDRRGDREERDRRGDREERDRRGDRDERERRGGDRDMGSWRSVRRTDDEAPRRPPPARGGGREGGSDWRRREETPRKVEERRAAPPPKEKPREQQAEEDDGWAEVKRR